VTVDDCYDLRRIPLRLDRIQSSGRALLRVLDRLRIHTPAALRSVASMQNVSRMSVISGDVDQNDCESP
jgi:hypothetical protein